MQITSVLKSVSTSLGVVLGFDSIDNGRSSGSDTSDNSSDPPKHPIAMSATDTPPSSPPRLLKPSRAASSPPSLPSPGAVSESNNASAGEVFSTDDVSTSTSPALYKVKDGLDAPTPYGGSSDRFMEENESLESQLVTQNPWRTLTKYRFPLKQTDLGLYSRFPLLRLPAELLLIVAGYLAPESVACLALACKGTYFTLGNDSFKMTKPELWRFLLLIEGEMHSSYACARCLTLHRPPESVAQNRFRCGISRHEYKWLRKYTMNLPDAISPGLVKMIGRKFLEDPRACQQYLSWAIMAAKKTTRYVRAATHVIPRLLDGSFVFRTETYIHAFVDGHLTHRSLVELAEQVGGTNLWPYSSRHRVPDLCCHKDWISCLTNLITLKKSAKPTKCVVTWHNENYHAKRCYSNEEIMTEDTQGRVCPAEVCDLIHRQPCKTCKPERPMSDIEDTEAHKARKPTPEDAYDGDIKGCRKCSTDFCISAREVPKLGLCLVLTTWKDLGGVGPGLSNKWDHHIQVSRFGPRVHQEDVRSGEQVGQAYEAFENLERSGLGPPQRYRPQPDRKMIRDLSRRVHKNAYRRAIDDTTDDEVDTADEEDIS